MNENEMSLGKKKTGLVIGIILLIVLLMAGALFYYFKTYLTAEKFLDRSVKQTISLVNKYYNNYVTNNFDINSNDIKLNGTLGIKTDAEDYKYINNLSLEYDLNLSLNNKYMGLSANLKQNSALLEANAYIKEKTAYIESNDLYTGLLKTTLDFDIFEESKESLSAVTTYTLEDYKYIITKVLDYLNTSILEEATLNTKVSGRSIEYTYDINNSNLKNFRNKFLDLLKADAKLAKLLELEVTEDTEVFKDLKDLKVIVTSDIISRNIKKIDITYEAEETNNIIVTRKDKNSYMINAKDESYDFTYSKNEITVKAYDNNAKQVGNIKIRLISKSEIRFTGSFTEDNNTVEFDITSKNSSSSKSNITGNIKVIDENSNKLSLDLNVTTEFGNNLITQKDTSNAKSLDNLTENEMLTFYTKLGEKISSFDFINFISNYLTSFDSSDYLM